MKSFADSSIDAIVTDPPYELGFMGKSWDSSGIAYSVELWSEALRVLKPGGHLLAFGGSRTFHRMAVAIEDAGFELRDAIAWLYGQGMPKGQLLKPSFEPIVVARKPLVGTLASNVSEHGTGALNIDACRVGMTSADAASINAKHAGMDVANYERKPGSSLNRSVNPMPLKAASAHELGRWPPNVLMESSQARSLDEQSGHQRDGVAVNRNKDPNADRPHTVYGGGWKNGHEPDKGYGGGGGASRFFPTFKYEAKAPTSERPVVDGVAHATVKPLKLMQWLVRLVTPPGGVVLDPFAGSGTTLEAAVLEGFDSIGIELEEAHLPLIKSRFKKPFDQYLDLGDIA